MQEEKAQLQAKSADELAALQRKMQEELDNLEDEKAALEQKLSV